MTRRPRVSPRGFVLPFVVVALAVTAMLALAFSTEALQAARATRMAEVGLHTDLVTESAMPEALSLWRRDSLWTQSLGTTVPRTIVANGQTVTVTWERLHPLVATVRVQRHSAGRRFEQSWREHQRTVWLEPPPVPLPASLVTASPVTGSDGSLVSGADVALPTSPCGRWRDTASVPPVVATSVSGSPAFPWIGAPAVVTAPADLAVRLRHAVTTLATRLAEQAAPSPVNLTPAAGWQARALHGDSMVIASGSAWQGVLLLRGPVRLAGTLRVHGLLVVEGPLDARGGTLFVQGAVVVADTSGRGVQLGNGAQLFFDRCAVQMALATVARPVFSPFALWQRLSH